MLFEDMKDRPTGGMGRCLVKPAFHRSTAWRAASSHHMHGSRGLTAVPPVPQYDIHIHCDFLPLLTWSETAYLQTTDFDWPFPIPSFS